MQIHEASWLDPGVRLYLPDELVARLAGPTARAAGAASASPHPVGVGPVAPWWTPAWRPGRAYTPCFTAWTQTSSRPSAPIPSA